jgi:very-short-patch-repair endonuclease
VLSQPIRQVRRARNLRTAMSLPEVLLWQELRRRPGGFRFRRQVPQAPYTIDFACLSARLAIEIDGNTHDFGARPLADERRDRIMAERGFRTLRIPAREVLKNMEPCIAAIVAACRQAGPPPPSLRDGPPPRAGEDFA